MTEKNYGIYWVCSKPIKLNLKAPDGRQIQIEASSREEFEYAMQMAQEFLERDSSNGQPANVPKEEM